MSAHSFAAPAAPVTVRAARMLVILEAGLLMLAALFAVLVGVVLGSGNSIPFAGAKLSGAGAVALGIVYGALGLGAGYVAVELGRLVPWARLGAVVLQTVLIVLFLSRGDLSVSTLVSVVLCLAVAGLLLSPTASAALTSSTKRPKP